MKRFAIIAALTSSSTAHAITVHRVTSLADHGSGTLRAAVESATDGDRVTFAPWLYQKTIRLDRQIIIDKRLRIEGDINGDRRPDITLDGQHTNRLLNVTPKGDLSLWAIAVESGKATKGGAIYNRGETNVQFSAINGNHATDMGGGIYNRGTLTIDNSSMRDNTAEQGGAICNDKTAAIGDKAKTTLVASTFTWNTARQQGGVIYNHRGQFGAINSTFGNNRAQKSTNWENDTAARGSVLFADGGSNKFSDSTLKNNKSAPIRNNEGQKTQNGGTIYNLGMPGATTLQIIRTVISESRGNNCGGLGYFNIQNSWTDDNSCPDTNRGDAKLGPLANYGGYTETYSPLPDSGLIDAAGNICTVRDQRGAPRKRYPDTHCDIGAVDAKASAPSRLRPQTINTTPPAEHNEDLAALHKTITAQQADISTKAETITALETQLQTLNAKLATVRTNMTNKDGNIAQLQTQAAELERKITEHQAQIAELEAPDELEATIGDAGEIKRLVLNGKNTLHESETTVKIGPTTIRLKNTIRQHIHKRKDGTTVSSGKFWGQNGAIHWEITTVTIPDTNWHASRWEFSSAQAFGDVALGIYADIDILPYTGFNGLIAGGEGHPNRLLITDRRNPSEGIALGTRALKNARMLGWVGSPDIYHGRNGEVLDESILTGAYSGWGSFRPDGGKYPGAAGYGPADIAVAIGIELKPSAKLATFTITLVGAPTGAIE
ncbi:choice-of-anchor Q domain-containing protein [Thiolapillus sp.]|uniref:choice-of-anchor Q domain-containing protein n=1 Tax=Thiolapillus sp. TaxID=2017437 RepID=UPI003AF43EB0